MIITKEWMKTVTRATGGAFNREQVKLLGIPMPTPKGFISSLVGKEIDINLAANVLAAQGIGVKRKKAKNFHAGHYHNEEKFGKTFATFYTKPFAGTWVWSYVHPSK